MIARTVLKNPVFPHAFVLTPKHSLPPGMPLKRPFILKASLEIVDQKFFGKLSTKDLEEKDDMMSISLLIKNYLCLSSFWIIDTSFDS